MAKEMQKCGGKTIDSLMVWILQRQERQNSLLKRCFIEFLVCSLLNASHTKKKAQAYFQELFWSSLGNP